MIYCKKHFVVAGFIFILPLVGWSEAPVVDESENFAIIKRQQVQGAPVVDSSYDDRQFDVTQHDDYFIDDEHALAKDDQTDEPNHVINRAKLIDKIQNLQQEIQELRGQLEVQAHELKLLQQQQVAFYKDLDARLNETSPSKNASNKFSLTLVDPKEPASSAAVSLNKTLPAPSLRINPADEQISYLAGYELVKNKRYDDAINSMMVFVQKYPKGGYTANAYYWLGELYLAKRDYVQAIKYFNVVLQQFPISNKSAASMLKIGYAYAAQGNRQEAKKFLQQVVSAYPDTPTAELARSKLHTI